MIGLGERGPGSISSEVLEKYLRSSLRAGSFVIDCDDVDGAKVERVERLKTFSGFNDVFAFTLNFSQAGARLEKNFILKRYVNAMTHPQYGINNTLRKCYREFQTMWTLGLAGYPVPKMYLFEGNSAFLGYPFMIMQKEKVKNVNALEFVDSFAANLAKLHNSNIDRLGIDSLEYPKDKFTFSQNILRHVNYLVKEKSHPRKLRKSFNKALHWLNENASQVYCKKYCLIHGDYKPLNSLVTEDSKLVTIDFEDTEIGDPAYDVGYAYNTVRFHYYPGNPELGEKTAERFVNEYSRHFEGDTNHNLLFYKVIGALNPSLLCSLEYFNPAKIYRKYGPKGLIAFPFLHIPLAARTLLGGDAFIQYLKYSEQFFESL